MKDEDTAQDEFLEALGEIAREVDAEDQDRFADRWHRLVYGELSEDEEAALRAEANLSGDLERFDDYEALRPLGEDFHNRMVLRLQEQQRRTKTIKCKRCRMRYKNCRHCHPCSNSL